MKRLAMILVAVVLMMVSEAQAGPYTYFGVDLVTEEGQPFTSATTVTVYRPGTTTVATIYSADSCDTAITNPIVSGLSNGSFTFYGDYPYYDIKIASTSYNTVIKKDTFGPNIRRIVFPTRHNTAIGADTNSICYIVKTKKITIGGITATTTDVNFASAANTSEQVLDCGAIVPAFARVVDVQLITTTAATFSGGATTLVAEIGSSSSGNQYAASATIYAVDVVLSCATGTAPIAAISASAGHVYVAATPGANWSTMTGGAWTLLVTYIDGGAIK